MCDHAHMHSSSRPSTGSQPARKNGLRRDRVALEARRRQAAKLFRQGLNQADVGRFLQVSRQSVSRWFEQWRQGGSSALKMSPSTGRPARLTPAQLRRVERALLQGARAQGYSTELWTLRRVAEVIERTTGVAYHQGHVWRLLRGLGWSRQKPARQAAERNPDAIEAWVKERWPELKRGSSGSEPGSSSRTKAVSR